MEILLKDSTGSNEDQESGSQEESDDEDKSDWNLQQWHFLFIESLKLLNNGMIVRLWAVLWENEKFFSICNRILRIALKSMKLSFVNFFSCRGDYKVMDDKRIDIVNVLP